MGLYSPTDLYPHFRKKKNFDKNYQPPKSPGGGLEDNIRKLIIKRNCYLSTLSLKPRGLEA